MSHVVKVPNAITLNQSLKKSSQGPTIVAYSHVDSVQKSQSRAKISPLTVHNSIKLRMPVSSAEVSALVGRFALEKKSVSQNFSKVFVAGFSAETNQGDGEMTSIGGLMLQDLRFDSFQ